MTDDIIIAQALEAELRADIQAYDKLPQYKVPRRLDKRISKLIRNSEKTQKTKRQNKPVTIKRRLLIAAIIVAVMAVLTGGITVITRYLGAFTVKQYDVFSMLTISNIEDSPLVLTEKYRLVMDDSQYTKKVIDDYEFTSTMFYSDKENGKYLCFSQSVKGMYETVRLNTENAITYPETVKLDDNNRNAIYFETYNREKVLIWELDESIIEIVGSGFSKNELIELSKFVKKVE